MVFVEGSLVFRHRIVVLPCFGNHHHDGFGKAAAGHHQRFESIVEVARVRAIRLDQRKQFLQIIAEQVTLHDPLASIHPVAVTANRVDFTVMSDESLRMGTIPAWECVR